MLGRFLQNVLDFSVGVLRVGYVSKAELKTYEWQAKHVPNDQPILRTSLGRWKPSPKSAIRKFRYRKNFRWGLELRGIAVPAPGGALIHLLQLAA